MNKILLLIAVPLLSHTIAFTRPCLYEGIAFYSQSAIDDFQINYPDCSQIEGSVVINGADITNLNGLNMVTSIGGYLWIRSNPILPSLAGLENLASVGAFLEIYSNNVLTSIQSLHNLTYVGEYIAINYNNSLISLAGLESLTSVNGNLGIAYNPVMTSLNGLENINSIGGFLSIGGNSMLSSLAELVSVSSIGGDLAVYNNSTLTSLMGLDNINAGSISSLMIKWNSSLSTCEVKSICDYLVSPNGSVEIGLNAPGCNSPEEVIATCQVGLEIVLPNSFALIPNPSTGLITVLLTEISPQSFITMMDLNGQELLHQSINEPKILFDISHFPGGIYLIRITNDVTVETAKLMKY